MNKSRFTTFIHTLRSLILLTCIFVSQSTSALHSFQAEYANGFERLVHLQNDGQSFYVLSSVYTQLRTNYVYKGKKNTFEIGMTKTTVKYESGESVVLNEEDPFDNSGYRMKYQYGLDRAFTIELGQESKTFITETEGYNITLESLQTNYTEFGAKAYLIKGASSALSIHGHYRYYFPGISGVEKSEFNIQRGNSWGARLDLELGRWFKKGLSLNVFMKFNQEQFEEKVHFQTRTEQTFGATLSLQF